MNLILMGLALGCGLGMATLLWLEAQGTPRPRSEREWESLYERHEATR